MDWYTLLVSAFTLDGSIIAIIITIAALMSFTIHNYFKTGLYSTPVVLAVMFLVGLFGHLTFFLSNIFFSFEPGRNAVIGASLAMAVFGVIAITVYCAYAIFSEQKRAARAARNAIASNEQPVANNRVFKINA